MKKKEEFFFFYSFLYFNESGVKIFLKLFINNCPNGTISITLKYLPKWDFPESVWIPKWIKNINMYNKYLIQTIY